jgi:thiol-disulfide isomerase/thioredoxin
MKNTVSKIFAIAALAFFAFAAGFLLSPSSTGASAAISTPTDKAALQALFTQTLSTPDGSPAQVGQWQNKRVLVINFWATWCPPCRRELPLFAATQRKYQGKDVQFVGIAIDNTDNVKLFSRTNDVSYPLLVGTDETSTIMRQLGNSRDGLPYTLLVANGQIVVQKLGEFTSDELERELQKLLQL